MRAPACKEADNLINADVLPVVDMHGGYEGSRFWALMDSHSQVNTGTVAMSLQTLLHVWKHAGQNAGIPQIRVRVRGFVYRFIIALQNRPSSGLMSPLDRDIFLLLTASCFTCEICDT